MAFSDNKITVADLTGKGVTGMADTPNLTTAQMQQKLDEIAKEVIPPKFNALCDDLDATDFASIITSKSTDKMLFQRLNEYDQIEYSVDNVNWFLVASGKEVLDPTLEADNSKKLGGQLPAYYQKTTDSALNTTDKTTTGAINEVKNALDNLSSDAVDINYDNTTSGLTATNVQDAIDEVSNSLNEIKSLDYSLVASRTSLEVNNTIEFDRTQYKEFLFKLVGIARGGEQNEESFLYIPTVAIENNTSIRMNIIADMSINAYGYLGFAVTSTGLTIIYIKTSTSWIINSFDLYIYGR